MTADFADFADDFFRCFYPCDPRDPRLRFGARWQGRSSLPDRERIGRRLEIVFGAMNILLPNQGAARNSRGRLSFAASGLSFAPFIFVAGAYPAVRELGRWAS